jgi:hypothetical protein
LRSASMFIVAFLVHFFKKKSQKHVDTLRSKQPKNKAIAHIYSILQRSTVHGQESKNRNWNASFIDGGKGHRSLNRAPGT